MADQEVERGRLVPKLEQQEQEHQDKDLLVVLIIQILLTQEVAVEGPGQLDTQEMTIAVVHMVKVE
jgi:hypothetical protein